MAAKENGALVIEDLRGMLKAFDGLADESGKTMRLALKAGAEVVSQDARDYFDEHYKTPATADYIVSDISPRGSIAWVQSEAISQHVHGHFGAIVMGIMMHARNKREEEVVVIVNEAFDALGRRHGF